MAHRPAGPNRYFPKVKEAREALTAKALELHELYMSIIRDAISKGDLKTAMEATQWLIDHVPAEDGERMIAESVDKPKAIEQKQGNNVNIGFVLGGLGEARSLPPAVTIDVEPVAVPDVEAKVAND